MEFSSYITETFLTEALTKGSQRVLNDKNLVANLADAIRDDVQMHPQNFPTGSKKTFPKLPDRDLAQWFLEQLDRIEAEGYEGTVYSRDGVWSEWITRRYIAGSHNFEDIIGVLNMNMRDWTLLKNRNMLEPTHKDIPKFNSVRDLGKYLSTHYHDKLEDIRAAAKNAHINKMAKRAKIVDNDDYSIFTVFNWAAARALGLGTQWCTANSQQDINYNNYSSRAMLFQLYPKNPEKVEKTGKVLGKPVTGTEKYQFDAGTPCFHDIADDPAPREEIQKKFPYLYSDLVKGLETHKGQLETAMKEMNDDPQLNTKESKTRVYDIDGEIQKLEKLQRIGYFTDKKRPKKKEAEPQAGEEPPPPAPEQGEPQMEEIRDLARRMLEGEFDIDDNDDSRLRTGNIARTPPTDPLAFGVGDVVRNKYLPNPLLVLEVEEPLGQWVGKSLPGELKVKDIKTGKEFNVAASQCRLVSKGGSTDVLENKGNLQMEDIDKDIEAMLESLKKYDVLKESISPVLGMVTLGEKKGGKPPWLIDAEKKAEGKEVEDEDDDDKEKVDESEDEELDERDEGKHNNGTTTGFKAVAKKAASEYGSKEAGERVAGAVRNKMKAAGKLEEEAEAEADPEVIEWMNRFDKLGRL